MQAHGIPARIERILTNYKFDNARTTSVALNPSWKLYTGERVLLSFCLRIASDVCVPRSLRVILCPSPGPS